MPEIDRKYYETDPAEKNPWRSYIIRNFTTRFLILLSLLIPLFVFYFVSILASISTTIGVFLAFISFIVYIYLLWKKELWNQIKR